MSLDLFIVIAFLITNVTLGVFSGISIKNINTYALGGRNFTTSTIVATIAATWIGGSNLSITIAETHKQGVLFLVCSLAEAISFWFIACFYAPRMGEFLGKLSVADAMHGIYQNSYVRSIIAVFSIVPAIGRVAMQFVVLQTIFSLWLGMSGVYASALSSLIIITYSSFGGIKSVTFTDLIQFFTFGVVIPMVAFLIWQSFHSDELIANTIMTDPLFNYSHISGKEKQGITDTIYLCLFLMIPILDPAIFQRISMSKNTHQVSRSFFVAIFFILICDAFVHTFIGILFRADSSVVDINESNVIQYIMDHYIHYGLKGVFVIGIMSMIMSTADSYINSSAILLSYDFFKALGIELKTKQQLQLARFCSLVIGILALLVSLFAKNLLDLLLSVYSFYIPIVTVPFTLAIFGFRTSSRALLISMVSGFCTVVYFETFASKYNIISGIPGTIVSVIFLMGSHYIIGEKGGWIGIKDQKKYDAFILAKQNKRKLFFHSIKNFSLIKYLQKNTPNEERIFVYFGLFCIITLFSNAYSLPRDLQEQHESILYPIFYSVLTLSTILITYPIWLNKFKHKVFIAFLWNIAVFYNLAFCSCLLSIIAQFSQIQVTVLMSSLITIAILMRWQMAIVIMLSGVILGIEYYKIYNGISVLPDHMNDLQFKITYLLLLISGILIAFFKPKQRHQEVTEDNNLFLSNKIYDQKNELYRLYELKNEFLRNIEHEAHTPITGITSMGQVLDTNYDTLDEKQRRLAIKNIAHSSERLKSLVNNLIDLSKLESFKYKLHTTIVDLTGLVYERLKICKNLYIEKQNIENVVLDLKIENKLKASCDKYYISRVIDNIIINAFQYCADGKITITLCKNKQEEILFQVQDEGIGIPKEEIFDIFGVFIVSSRTKTPAGGRGVGLALAKKVIDLHNGRIWAKQNTEKGVTVGFNIPVKTT